MNQRIIVRLALGALMAISTVGLTACQSAETSAEPVAFTGQTDTDEAQSVKKPSSKIAHRNWGKMHR